MRLVASLYILIFMSLIVSIVLELPIPIRYYKVFHFDLKKRDYMLKLIYYQYIFRKSEWLGALPVLIVAGMITGTCFTILINILANTEVFIQDIPTPLFIAPIFFGGLTLFFLISTLIRLLLNIFKSEYRIWDIIGASRWQLSILIGGQFAIVTLISSFIGSILSIFPAKSYYILMQGRVGEEYFPSIPIRFSFMSVIFTTIILTLVSYISSFYNAYLLLDGNFFTEDDRIQKKNSKIRKIVLFGINLFLWLSLIIGSIIVPYLDLPGGVKYKLSFMSSAIFYLLVIHMFFVKYQSPWIELKILRILFNKGRNFATIISRWNVIEKKYFLSSVTISMVTAITLITGLLLISNNGIRSGVEQNKEIYISFLFYLAAPLFIIVSNLISVTIIISEQDKSINSKLETIGVSNIQMIKIKLLESIIYSTIVLIISMFLNGIISLLVINIVNYTDLLIFDTKYFLFPALIISLVLCITVFLTKIIITFYNCTK